MVQYVSFVCPCPVLLLGKASAVMQGSSPSIHEALDLHFILSKSDTQLRQPVGLEEQLMSDARLDSVVGMSMLQLLQVIPSSFAAATSQEWCCKQHSPSRSLPPATCL